MQGDPVACQSQIKIKFGECEGVQSSGISIDLAVEFNSTKIENKRFNISEYANMQIPSNSFLIELQVNSDVEDVIEELNKIRQNSQSFKYVENQLGFSIKFAGKDKFVYVLLTSDQIQEAIKKINKKVEGQVGSDGQRWVDAKFLSKNTLSELRKLIEKKGTQSALLDSLLVNIKFNKVEGIQNMIKSLIKKMFGQGLSQLVISVEELNLSLSFDSSQLIDNMKSFPKKNKEIEINDDFKPLQSLLSNKLTFYVFGKPLSLTGNATGEDLYLILDILLA